MTLVSLSTPMVRFHADAEVQIWLPSYVHGRVKLLILLLGRGWDNPCLSNHAGAHLDTGARRGVMPRHAALHSATL